MHILGVLGVSLSCPCPALTLSHSHLSGLLSPHALGARSFVLACFDEIISCFILWKHYYAWISIIHNEYISWHNLFLSHNCHVRNDKKPFANRETVQFCSSQSLTFSSIHLSCYFFKLYLFNIFNDSPNAATCSGQAVTSDSPPESRPHHCPRGSSSSSLNTLTSVLLIVSTSR